MECGLPAYSVFAEHLHRNCACALCLPRSDFANVNVRTQWCRFLSQEVRETKPRKWIPHHGHRAPNNYGKKYHIIWEPRLVTISDFKSIVEPFIRRDAASDKLLLSMTGELLHKMLCGNSALPNVYCQSAALSVRLVVCYLILAADFTFLAQRTKFGPGGPPNFKLD